MPNKKKSLLSQPKNAPGIYAAGGVLPLAGYWRRYGAIKTNNVPVCVAIIKGGFIGRAVRAAFRAGDLQ